MNFVVLSIVRHKLYGIKRKSDFITSNVNLLYNIDGNYIKYCKKIESLMSSNNIDYIANELLLQPNLILSIIDNEKKEPLLGIVTRYDNNIKMFVLILNSIFHFGEIMLHNSKYEQRFISDYFNYNQCKNIIEFNPDQFVKYNCFI